MKHLSAIIVAVVICTAVQGQPTVTTRGRTNQVVRVASRLDLAIGQLRVRRATILRAKENAEKELARVSKAYNARSILRQPTAAEVARSNQIQNEQQVRDAEIAKIDLLLLRLEDAKRLQATNTVTRRGRD